MRGSSNNMAFFNRIGPWTFPLGIFVVELLWDHYTTGIFIDWVHFYYNSPNKSIFGSFNVLRVKLSTAQRSEASPMTYLKLQGTTHS